MILYRYLSRQILSVMAAVTVVLLIVGLINRFIQYLGQAVAGEMAADVLLLLVFYRLPDFLLVILPLALFLGILLVYGRMYAENEMTVLVCAGLGPGHLLRVAWVASALLVLLVGLLSFEVAPWGIRNTERLKARQAELTEVDLMVAGQFQAFSAGGRVTYTERIATGAEGRQLENVFVVATAGEGDTTAPVRVILADRARAVTDPATGQRYLRLEQVNQYDGRPGQADFTVARAAAQAILLPEPRQFDAVAEEKALRTSVLLGSPELPHVAELQWRISALLLIPVIALMAVPLSRVNPRQGRFGKLVPAALVYALYFVLLQVCRERVADGSLSPLLGLWWVHVLFLAAGIALFLGRGPRLARGR